MERPAHDVAGLVGAGDDFGALEYAFPGAGRKEVGTHEQHVEGIAARQRENRHIVGIGLGEAADGVLGAGL